MQSRFSRPETTSIIGTPERVAQRVSEFEAAGVDLLLLQCSPQYEEMERFAKAVIQTGAAATKPLKTEAT